MLYYIIYNGQQVGPMPKEELAKYGLNPGSKVWAEGMPNWVDAATVADLRSVLYPQPQMPPQSPYQGQGGYQQPPYQGQGGYASPRQCANNQQYSYGNNADSVSFGDAIKICFNKYADFEGRARRSEYWWWCLFTFLVGLAVGWIPVVGQIASLAFLIPSYAVGARRLHDTGRSGWWQLLHLTCVGSIILIIWFCEDSHEDNEYGPSPKYPSQY